MKKKTKAEARAERLFKTVYPETWAEFGDQLYCRRAGWKRLARYVLALERKKK